ncbi:MAG TPA: transcriptional regulator [Streptosporangiaceae bacterium]|jgi:predicted ArsR family transcriptional regulator
MVRDDPGLAAVIGLGDPVRRRLYEMVSGSAEPVRRDEAAAATGIGCQLAAYHLDKLVGLGLLTASYQRGSGRPGSGRPGSGRPGSGAGRPAKVYTRSGSEFAVTVPPREYELAAHLLAVAVESDTAGSSRPALLAAAQRFGNELAHRPGTAGMGPALATESTLRAHGYEPWQDAEGTIRLHNCPFHQLAARHPGLVCGMNLALISGLVEGLGAAPLHPVLDPKPGFCCVAIGTGQSADLPRRP